MNFYKHHIGDYAQATAHLSFVEDAAYSRMIRKYYAEEKPLPLEVKAVQRLIGARTKEEKQAVEDVLQEFFSKELDGWHNKRCDSEIEKNREADQEREAKNANEKERQRRHREERAKLFEALRGLDIVPSYDTKTETLRTLLSNALVTPPVTRDEADMSQPVTPPVTRIATANQTPDSRLQTPEITPPIPPKGGNQAIEFKTFVAKCKESGEKLIADYRPVFDYAEKVQLPIAMVQLCWDEFQRRYSPGGPSESKRYKDWRKVFRNCVEGNWFKLWWLNPATDAFELTTAGRTAGRSAA